MDQIKHDKLKNGVLRYDHLLGIPFEHGVNDCYTAFQRIFYDNLGLKFTNYARPNDWWIEKDMDLYNENYRKEGFNKIDISNLRDLRVFDCFLIAIPDPRNPSHTVANHIAVYVGNGLIFHHRYGKLSTVQPYRHAMSNWTTAVIRHKDVPDLQPKVEQNLDVMDYILPHNREKLLGAMNDAKSKRD